MRTELTPAQAASFIIIAVAVFATAILMAIVERIENSNSPNFSACPLCGTKTDKNSYR
jgi:hypothetical protein